MDLEILIEEVWLKLLEAADLHSTLTTGLIRVDSWGSITPLCLELSPHLSCTSVAQPNLAQFQPSFFCEAFSRHSDLTLQPAP